MRVRQLNGKPVPPDLLAEALRVIAETNTPTGRRAFNRKTEQKKRRERQACPCPQPECPADQAAVVQALKPWALLTAANQPANPEAYAWPRAL